MEIKDLRKQIETETGSKVVDVVLSGGNGIISEEKKEIIHDKSVLMKVNGKIQNELSATPVDLPEMTAGWLCSRNLISQVDDIREITIMDADEDGVKDADIVIDALIDDNSTKTAEEIHGEKIKIDAGQLIGMVENCNSEGPLRKRTAATHSCMLIEITDPPETKYRLLHCSEDTGRHTAMDKAIGYGLIHHVDLGRCILLTSGRISSNMIRKAAACHISAVLSIKQQTTVEAIAAAKENEIMLAGISGKGELIIYERAGLI